MCLAFFFWSGLVMLVRFSNGGGGGPEVTHIHRLGVRRWRGSPLPLPYWLEWVYIDVLRHNTAIRQWKTNVSIDSHRRCGMVRQLVQYLKWECISAFRQNAPVH